MSYENYLKSNIRGQNAVVFEGFCELQSPANMAGKPSVIMQRLPTPGGLNSVLGPAAPEACAGRKAIVDVVVASGTVAYETLTASLHKKNEVFTAWCTFLDDVMGIFPMLML